MRESQEEAIAFLSDPRSYGLGGGTVERHETHGAIVFLAGDRAYKLKRAVRYPYMDYSTEEARKTMCERELAINRRTAPEMYLAVLPIMRSARGQLGFGSGDTCDAHDWVVVMRRFEQSDLLADMRRRGLLTRALMRHLADAIAAFHNRAELAPDFGGAPGIGAVLDENAVLLREFCPEDLRARVERLTELAAAALERSAALLDRRRIAGRVRRCHGDLHLNNICMIRGRPVLFDAIEFNDSFACIDVLYDLAFPLMDLMRHGVDACANTLLNRYLERSRDYEGLAALPLFLSCRAAISAHVAVSRAKETGGDIEWARKEFRDLIELGIAVLTAAAPRLVAIGGVSGTGKSTLAYDLAPALPPAPGAIVLRSDVLRKEIMEVAETERLPESAYTDEMHDRVYSTLGIRAATVLRAGYSVIADAVFGNAAQRAAIEHAAGKAGITFSGLWLDAPVATLERRIAERHCDASDATVEVLHRQIAHVTTPTEWKKVHAADSAAATLAHARTVVPALDNMSS